MKSEISTFPSIEEFARLVADGINAWVQAGKILNALIEKDESVRQRITDQIPWMTRRVLDGFERIGRGEIYPQLLLDRSPGAHALIALPYYEQQRLHSASIAIAVWKKGEVTTEHRRLQDLTPREVDLVFSEVAIRPLAEQSKIILARNRPKQAAPRTPERVEEEPEEAAPQSLDDDPLDSPESHLSRAQSELIRVRELIGQEEDTHRLDFLITAALTAIGKLRYQLKEMKEP